MEQFRRPLFVRGMLMEGGRLIIDVIDNGGQWTHREWRMLRQLGVDTKIIENNTPVEKLRSVDGLLLSGGAARIGLTSELGANADYLSLEVPILGICAGMQFIARHYGGSAREAKEPEFGAMTIHLVNGGGVLFEGTENEQIVWESHNDEVNPLPPNFKQTAKSESCAIQAFEDEEGLRFGLQFHPEVNDTEYGERIISNFIEVCRKHKSAN